MSAPLSKTRCRRGPRRFCEERVWRALRPTRRRRCEARPDWLDDDGLAAALVPRRPRGPRLGGAVALERPVDAGCDG